MNRTHRPVRIALVIALTVALVLAWSRSRALRRPRVRGNRPERPASRRSAGRRCGKAREEAVRPGREAVREDEGDALPQGQKTITVGAPAAKAHLRLHGDKLGRCP